MRTIR
ncbi:6346887b-7c77-47d7-95d1-d7b9119bf0e2 [Thermothielavioides terrestris]